MVNGGASIGLPEAVIACLNPLAGRDSQTVVLRDCQPIGTGCRRNREGARHGHIRTNIDVIGVGGGVLDEVTGR